MYRKRRSFKRRRYSKKRYLRRRYRKTGRFIRLARQVRRIVNSQKETHYDLSESENLQLYHNVATTCTFDPWSGVLKGDEYFNRTGDELRIVGMKFKLWIANKLDRPNVMYRIVGGWCPRSINGGVITPTNVWTYVFEAARNTGVVGNCILGTRANRYGIKYLVDKTYNLQVGQSGTNTSDKECHMRKSFYFRPKYNRMRYNGNYPQGKVFFLGLMCYDSYGTLTTDNIASYSFCQKLFWKDD